MAAGGGWFNCFDQFILSPGSTAVTAYFGPVNVSYGGGAPGGSGKNLWTQNGNCDHGTNRRRPPVLRASMRVPLPVSICVN